MPPGLIFNTQSGTSRRRVLGQPVATAGTTTYDPERRAVSRPTETVQGQLESVLSADSPFIQRARTRAAQVANQRGLLNSSIAAGAGEAAAIDAALPIAVADANVYGTAARENQAAGNRALEFGAGESNVNARQNAEAINQISRMGYGAELERGLIGTRTGAEKELIGARTEGESRLLGERGTQERLNIGASGEQQRLNIGASGAQERATQAERAMQQAALSAQEAVQSGQLSAQQAAQQQAQSLLEGEIRAGLITTQEQADARLRELQGQIEERLIGARTGGERELIQARGLVESGLSAQQAAQQIAQTRVQGEVESGLITTREQSEARLRQIAGEIEEGLIGTRTAAESQLLTQRTEAETQLTQLRGQLDQQLQTLRGTQATDLANIEANYKSLIQANTSAGAIYSETIKMMAGIMADPNTSTEQKQNAVDRVTQMLESGLTVIGAVANIDLVGLLDFSAPTP